MNAYLLKYDKDLNSYHSIGIFKYRTSCAIDLIIDYYKKELGERIRDDIDSIGDLRCNHKILGNQLEIEARLHEIGDWVCKSDKNNTVIADISFMDLDKGDLYEYSIVFCDKLYKVELDTLYDRLKTINNIEITQEFDRICINLMGSSGLVDTSIHVGNLSDQYGNSCGYRLLAFMPLDYYIKLDNKAILSNVQLWNEDAVVNFINKAMGIKSEDRIKWLSEITNK